MSLHLFISLVLFSCCLSSTPSHAFDPYLSPRLGIPLSTLQAALEKVAGPIVFAPRPNSPQGTQEARLPENAGIVQAGGGPENLAAAVLWLPVDAQGHLGGGRARSYLEAFVGACTADSQTVVSWVMQVLERAVAAPGNAPYLESRLLPKHQLKTTYVPTLSPPMLSLTVIAVGEENDPQ
jgi:hypothetical protein